MKKKLIVTTAIVLLLALSMTMFAGCDEIFKKNDKRDALQIVATVNYDGKLGSLSDSIYKFELASSFNSYAYYYVNYYGMSYEQTATYLAQSLAQQRLLVLYAKDKVAQLEGKTSIPEIKELLSASEYNRAIENSNESLLSSLVSIVESLITEDNANVSTSTKKDNSDDVEVTEPITVRFETNGATAIDKQKIQKGTTAKEPTAPTKDGYTFYGWYETADFSGEEFDFDTQLNASTVLYAKWEKYLAPRTELPEAAEEDDYDPDDDTVTISAKFFSEEYKADLYDESDEESIFNKSFLEADFVENIIVEENSTLVATLKEYIAEGLAEFEKELIDGLYKDTVEECYEYYLNSQMQSLLITRLQRMIGEEASVSEAEVEAEFNAALAKNKETFAGSSANYQSALTSSLSTTYYHPVAEQGYGFVINILFKLDDENLKVLTDMMSANPDNAEAVTLVRNRLLSEMTASVSNPKYSSTAIVEDENGKQIELRDAMTDANNPYNNVGKTEYNHEYQYKVSENVYANDYSQILSFEKNADGKYEIVFKATEHPAMAYLLEKVPVFDQNDGTVGLIHQIHNSLNQVKAAVAAGDLTKEQGVYWLREVATTWAYLVGDDSGAVSSDSNNNGLGYLVTPEGKDSSYLADFTTYARKLIANGTGSFSDGNVDDAMFKGLQDNATDFVGNQKAFVVADSFIESGSTSNAYAGVFVLLNSNTVWDASAYGYGKELPKDGIIPTDYVVAVGKDVDDVKTIHDNIYDSLLEAKKSDLYKHDVNEMSANNEDSIEYFNDVIKQLWKDLDA